MALKPQAIYVTEFWKITLMVMPETIRIFQFTIMLLTAEKPSKIFLTIFL